MQKIGLVVNHYKDHALALEKKLVTWLGNHEKEVIQQEGDCIGPAVDSADLIICLGGDGTLLKTAGMLKRSRVPILGVNLGRLGFMTTVREEELFEELEAVFQGSFDIEERLLLKPLCNGEDLFPEKRSTVLNDVVISKEGASRYLEMLLRINDKHTIEIAGDGVIIATPSGSTAYSLSAGGPFVMPTLDAFLITPLCPHSLKNRSYVVPADTTVSVIIHCKKENEYAYVILDGQQKRKIFSTDRIEIRKAEATVRLIKSHKRCFFDIVNDVF